MGMMTNSTLSRRHRDIVDGHGGEIDRAGLRLMRCREESEAIMGLFALLYPCMISIAGTDGVKFPFRLVHWNTQIETVQLIHSRYH
jgi:hypothetical protein